MDPMLDFTGKVALITGAASGFGKLLAAELLGRIAQSVGMEAKTDMLDKDILPALVELLKEGDKDGSKEGDKDGTAPGTGNRAIISAVADSGEQLEELEC